MYKELSITNFRALKNVRVRNIGNINIITGGNGTGKSTLLEAIFLNAGANHAALSISLNGLRGDAEIHSNNDAVFHSLFHDLDANRVIDINCHYQRPNSKVVSRNLKITPRLKQKIGSGETGVDVFVNGLDFLYGTKLLNSKKEKISKGNINFAEDDGKGPFAQSKVDTSALLECRYISPMVPTIREISERISTVIKSKEIGSVVELLKIIDPRISDITTLSESGRNQVYVDIGLDNLMPATYMGGGFIRLLNLAISMSTEKILLIDEIENGLHYSTHKPLLEFIFNASIQLNRQLFITTHSSEFLDKFIGVTSDFENVNVSAYRCFRKNEAVNVSMYTKEELGLREQLDIELR